MSTNPLVFHTSKGISSNSAAFSFFNFPQNWLSFSCVTCPSLMSNCLQIILGICSRVTFGGFRSKFSKCWFHNCIRSSWLVAFTLALAVLFLLCTSFTSFLCYPRLSIFNRVSNLIGLYSICSFRYMLANSFCAFLNFRALVLVGFFLLYLEAVFKSARFLPTTNVSQGNLSLALCLVGMHSAAAFNWALTKILEFVMRSMCFYLLQ